MARLQPASRAGLLSIDSELVRRVLFTIGALVILRLGGLLPLPGINPDMFLRVLPVAASGVLGSDAARRLSIFALGVMPYVSACVIVYVIAAFSSRLRSLRWSGPMGMRQLNHYIRVVALALTAFQGFGLAGAFEGIRGLVPEPGLGFRIGVTVSLVAGTAFLLWLGEQVSQRGIGDGVWLLLAADTIAGLPQAAFGIFDLGIKGRLPEWALPACLAAVVALTALIVLAERAVRIVPAGSAGGQSIRLRLNYSGILAPTLASSLLLVPLMIASTMSEGGAGLGWIAAVLGRGQLVFFLLYAALITFFVFFFAAAAVDLARASGASSSPESFDAVFTRVTALGALYLVVLCLAPEAMIGLPLPVHIGGTSLLITVLVAMDIIAKWQHIWRAGTPSG
jgi:preprotein translocase subunit SecY